MADILKHCVGGRFGGSYVSFKEGRFSTKEVRLRPSIIDSPVPVDVTMLVEDYRTERRYWYFDKRIYWTTDESLTPEDVRALINEAANRRRLKLEKAHALQAMSTELDSRAKRQAIPQETKVLVWQRDGGRCVGCGSQENLEFDHIIPLAMGGANTARNLQLLCEVCNRRKGASLG